MKYFVTDKSLILNLQKKGLCILGVRYSSCECFKQVNSIPWCGFKFQHVIVCGKSLNNNKTGIVQDRHIAVQPCQNKENKNICISCCNEYRINCLILLSSLFEEQISVFLAKRKSIKKKMKLMSSFLSGFLCFHFVFDFNDRSLLGRFQFFNCWFLRHTFADFLLKNKNIV